VALFFVGSSHDGEAFNVFERFGGRDSSNDRCFCSHYINLWFIAYRELTLDAMASAVLLGVPKGNEFEFKMLYGLNASINWL